MNLNECLNTFCICTMVNYVNWHLSIMHILAQYYFTIMLEHGMLALSSPLSCKNFTALQS
jgi:hypothetical protein